MTTINLPSNTVGCSPTPTALEALASCLLTRKQWRKRQKTAESRTSSLLFITVHGASENQGAAALVQEPWSPTQLR